MTFKFDVKVDDHFFGIDFYIDNIDDHLFSKYKNDIGKICLEFVRLINNDKNKYNDFRKIKLSNSSNKIFKTTTTLEGYRKIKRFLLSEYFDCKSIPHRFSHIMVYYQKDIKEYELKRYHYKIEEYRLDTPIKSINDLY